MFASRVSYISVWYRPHHPLGIEAEWSVSLTSTLALARPLSFFVSTSYDKMTEGNRTVKISVHMLPETMLELKLSALHTDSATSRRSYFPFSFFLAVFEGNSYRYLEAERETPHKCEIRCKRDYRFSDNMIQFQCLLWISVTAFNIYPYSRLG